MVASVGCGDGGGEMLRPAGQRVEEADIDDLLILLSQVGDGIAGDHVAFADTADAVTKPLHQVELVRGKDDGHAFCVAFFEDIGIMDL
ncbi:hypothetical protein SAMN05660282_01416 [Corynebacterium spheniscorum]|uniref:Uncharacterized protein n=1 Tax=Corynebacterium spheniscorum TaxID=185761 RepID=A0A1I2TCI0_9CORY|nr:hypothetical protein SAMN05660282_01416 [Corynebacterium spheniscorum]